MIFLLKNCFSKKPKVPAPFSSFFSASFSCPFPAPFSSFFSASFSSSFPAPFSSSFPAPFPMLFFSKSYKFSLNAISCCSTTNPTSCFSDHCSSVRYCTFYKKQKKLPCEITRNEIDMDNAGIAKSRNLNRRIDIDNMKRRSSFFVEMNNNKDLHKKKHKVSNDEQNEINFVDNNTFVDAVKNRLRKSNKTRNEEEIKILSQEVLENFGKVHPSEIGVVTNLFISSGFYDFSFWFGILRKITCGTGGLTPFSADKVRQKNQVEDFPLISPNHNNATHPTKDVHSPQKTIHWSPNFLYKKQGNIKQENSNQFEDNFRASPSSIIQSMNGKGLSLLLNSLSKVYEKFTDIRFLVDHFFSLASKHICSSSSLDIFYPQSVSLLVNAFARIVKVDTNLFLFLIPKIVFYFNSKSFDPQHFSSVLYAYGKLNVVNESLIAAAISSLPSYISKLSTLHISNVTYSFIKLGVKSENVFSILNSCAIQNIEKFSHRELVMLLHSLSERDQIDASLYKLFINMRIAPGLRQMSFNSQELNTLVHTFSRIHVMNRKYHDFTIYILNVLAFALTQTDSFKIPEIANILNSYSKVYCLSFKDCNFCFANDENSLGLKERSNFMFVKHLQNILIKHLSREDLSRIEGRGSCSDLLSALSFSKSLASSSIVSDIVERKLELKDEKKVYCADLKKREKGCAVDTSHKTFSERIWFDAFDSQSISLVFNALQKLKKAEKQINRNNKCNNDRSVEVFSPKVYDESEEMLLFLLSKKLQKEIDFFPLIHLAISLNSAAKFDTEIISNNFYITGAEKSCTLLRMSLSSKNEIKKNNSISIFNIADSIFLICNALARKNLTHLSFIELSIEFVKQNWRTYSSSSVLCMLINSISSLNVNIIVPRNIDSLRNKNAAKGFYYNSINDFLLNAESNKKKNCNHSNNFFLRECRDQSQDCRNLSQHYVQRVHTDLVNPLKNGKLIESFPSDLNVLFVLFGEMCASNLISFANYVNAHFIQEIIFYVINEYTKNVLLTTNSKNNFHIISQNPNMKRSFDYTSQNRNEKNQIYDKSIYSVQSVSNDNSVATLNHILRFMVSLSRMNMQDEAFLVCYVCSSFYKELYTQRLNKSTIEGFLYAFADLCFHSIHPLPQILYKFLNTLLTVHFSAFLNKSSESVFNVNTDSCIGNAHNFSAPPRCDEESYIKKFYENEEDNSNIVANSESNNLDLFSLYLCVACHIFKDDFYDVINVKNYHSLSYCADIMCLDNKKDGRDENVRNICTHSLCRSSQNSANENFSCILYNNHDNNTHLVNSVETHNINPSERRKENCRIHVNSSAQILNRSFSFNSIKILFATLIFFNVKQNLRMTQTEYESQETVQHKSSKFASQDNPQTAFYSNYYSPTCHLKPQKNSKKHFLSNDPKTTQECQTFKFKQNSESHLHLEVFNALSKLLHQRDQGNSNREVICEANAGFYSIDMLF